MSSTRNVFLFNIGETNWETCVRGPADEEVHGEEHVGNPCYGVRTGVHGVPINSIQEGDLVLARRKNDTAGIAGIWRITACVEIDDSQARNIWRDVDYEWIIYCEPVQREFEPIFEEDWQQFVESLDKSLAQITAKIQGPISRLWPDLKREYLSSLMDHDPVNAEARELLSKELKEVDGPHRCTASSETAPFYWVNQTQNSEEIANEFLQAPADDHWHHDVAKLEAGDIVFNYNDGEIIGYSEVIAPASSVTVDGEEYCRIEVSVHEFEQPPSLAEVLEYLLRDEVTLEKYYPVNQGGINQQYLFNLSEAAGEYLLELGAERQSQAERLENRLELPPVTVAMPQELHFHGPEEADLRRQIEAALNSGKNIQYLTKWVSISCF